MQNEYYNLSDILSEGARISKITGFIVKTALRSYHVYNNYRKQGKSKRDSALLASEFAQEANRPKEAMIWKMIASKES